MTAERSEAGGTGLTREQIKYIAIAAMTVNHIGTGLLPDGLVKTVMQDIGYFTAIVMCFFLAEGFRYTSSKRRYGLRLLLFGFISQIPFFMAFGYPVLNMMFTLFLCFLLLIIRTDGRFAGKRLVPGLLVVFLSSFCDWPFLAPVVTLLFYNAGTDWEERKKACGFVVILYLIFTFVSTCGTVYRAEEALLRAVCSAVAPAAACLTILFLYNGKENSGKGSRTWGKWFFYIYYPAHLLLIGIVRTAAGV